MLQGGKRIALFAFSCIILLLISFFIAGFLSNPERDRIHPIVIRIDDIQDYAFMDGQLFLVDYALATDIPASLAIIAGKFSSDEQIVNEVKSALQNGCEVTVHGWYHEDFSILSEIQQMKLLFQAKSRLREILNVTTEVFVPPMSYYNEDTPRALKEEEFSIVSISSYASSENVFPGIVNILATVELSEFVQLENGQELWQMKSIAEVLTEVAVSLNVYGYAVIVVHPQEFLFDETSLNRTRCDLYSNLLEILRNEYMFTTLRDLAAKQV